MKFNLKEEDALNKITSLFERRGFRRFRSGCFEEYSLYRDNESFLVGKNVITFTDLTGRLMAIRPDVTLSLIRRTEIHGARTCKYFYNESVYRRATGGKDFREISQTGAEVVGRIDGLCEVELVSLMCETLGIISPDYILDISHVGYTEGLLSEFGDGREEVKDYLSRKDVHDFIKLAQNQGYGKELVNAFISAAELDGNAVEAIEKAKKTALNLKMKSALDELEVLVSRLSVAGLDGRININFSMANDADYYSGLVFNGYIDGVPHCVLTGGRYDNLLHKFGKEGGAIGFAVYLGEIERYFASEDVTVDCLIVYDDDSEDKALKLARDCFAKGKSVRLDRNADLTGCTATEIFDLTEGVKR